MEYFASDPRVLARINKHYKTGESLPLDVIEKLCATKKIFAAVELQSQLVFSVLDQVRSWMYWEPVIFCAVKPTVCDLGQGILGEGGWMNGKGVSIYLFMNRLPTYLKTGTSKSTGFRSGLI